MSSSVPVRIVHSAAKAIHEAAEWWVANRPNAPDAFAVELERAIQLLSLQPSIGAQVRDVKLAGVRRIHLTRIHYHLYYRVIAEPTTVEILALWHTKRGYRLSSDRAGDDGNDALGYYLPRNFRVTQFEFLLMDGAVSQI